MFIIVRVIIKSFLIFKYRIDFSNDPIVGPGPLGATGGEGSNSHTY